MYYGPANEIMYGFLNQFQEISYLMIFMFFTVLTVKNNRQETEYLIGLILIGGIIFSALYEAKSRYVYPFAVVGTLYMVVGIVICYDQLKKYVDRMRTKGLERNAREK